MRSVFVIALFALAACGQAHPAVALRATVDDPKDAGKISRFRIGNLDAYALEDGTIDVPNDSVVFGLGRSPRDVAAVLSAASLPTDTLSLSIQPLLVKDASHVLLFDTGARDASFAHAGHLPASLALTGVAAAEVTDIFISHAHPDHIGGLVTKSNALAFPNATIHIAKPEWLSMQKDPKATTIISAIASKLAPFEPGATILPEVTAVASPGHTPGHSSYEISSAGDKLLYLGDVAHHYVVSLQKPEWSCGWDEDKANGEKLREQTLATLARSGEHVYAGHVPFPGLGHVRVSGAEYAWVPDH
jgi:glyoxylase-like metal-dependent hydrolase (beta-lactamase superfamily II)